MWGACCCQLAIGCPLYTPRRLLLAAKQVETSSRLSTLKPSANLCARSLQSLPLLKVASCSTKLRADAALSPRNPDLQPLWILCRYIARQADQNVERRRWSLGNCSEPDRRVHATWHAILQGLQQYPSKIPFLASSLADGIVTATSSACMRRHGFLVLH